MTSEKRWGLIAGIVVIVTLLVLGTWWLLRPSYQALFEKLDDKQQAEVLAALVEWNAPYRLQADKGMIEVPADQVEALRGRLATAGIASTKAKGFELFDNADYGMSEFAQRINYQRALEGELARSIMTLRPVRFARVHLTLQKASLFASNRITPKASVVVQSKANERLSATEIAGIAQLIAAAVEGLDASAISIIDERGNPLAANDGNQALGDRAQLQSSLESDLEQRAMNLLHSALGAADAAVSVRVQANFDKVRSIRDEVLLPGGQSAGVVLRKKEHRADSPLVTENKDGEPGKKAPASVQSEVEYAYGKQHSEIEHARGQIERISVGIVLTQAISGTSFSELEAVLTAGLGMEQARGDKLVLTIARPMTRPQMADAAVVSADELPAELTAESHTWSWALSILLVLSLVVIAALVARAQTRVPAVLSPRRLNENERETLLLELQQWLHAETKSGGRS